VETIGRVRHAFHVKGKKIKQIARGLRLARNTVRSIVRGKETERTYA
jgi:plasmid maintenance system antidote protein VapI